MRITSSGDVAIGTSTPLLTASGRGNLTINGSSNSLLSFGIGGASSGYIFSSSTALEVDAQNSRHIQFNTNGAERMRITSGGNVGIGTSSPNGNLEVSSAASTVFFRVGSTSSGNAGTFDMYSSGTGGFQAGTVGFNTGNSVPILFSIGATERMRITSGGYLFINTSSSVAGVPAQIEMKYTGSATYGMNMRTTSGDGVPLSFLRSDGAQVGYIYTTSAATLYSTTSDYRLKEDFKPLSGLEKVLAIKTYDYKWKDSEDRMDGVLAHELQEVIPYAVNGKKDELNKDGSIKTQGVDYSKLVPILVNAIQELEARIKQLENK
jgi:hypothetical protein